MRSNCGLVKSDAAQDELTKLPFKIGGVAVGETRHHRKPRQRGHQHGVMCKPEQVERFIADLDRIAGSYGALERFREHAADQIAVADCQISAPRSGRNAFAEREIGTSRSPFRGTSRKQVSVAARRACAQSRLLEAFATNACVRHTVRDEQSNDFAHHLETPTDIGVERRE